MSSIWKQFAPLSWLTVNIQILAKEFNNKTGTEFNITLENNNLSLGE